MARLAWIAVAVACAGLGWIVLGFATAQSCGGEPCHSASDPVEVAQVVVIVAATALGVGAALRKACARPQQRHPTTRQCARSSRQIGPC